MTQVFIVVLALHILSLTPLCVDFPLFLKSLLNEVWSIAQGVTLFFVSLTQGTVVYRAGYNTFFL